MCFSFLLFFMFFFPFCGVLPVPVISLSLAAIRNPLISVSLPYVLRTAVQHLLLHLIYQKYKHPHNFKAQNEACKRPCPHFEISAIVPRLNGQQSLLLVKITADTRHKGDANAKQDPPHAREDMGGSLPPPVARAGGRRSSSHLLKPPS